MRGFFFCILLVQTNETGAQRRRGQMGKRLQHAAGSNDRPGRFHLQGNHDERDNENDCRGQRAFAMTQKISGRYLGPCNAASNADNGVAQFTSGRGGEWRVAGGC